MNINLIYNDKINRIKEEERLTHDLTRLGRHRDPAPIEINLTKNFVKLNHKRTKLLDPETVGGVNYSLFTVKHHLPRSPRPQKTPPKPKVKKTPMITI